MRSERPLQGLIRFVMPLLGAFALMMQGCTDDNQKARFYTYCDNTGCYSCDANGCGALPGRPPGVACKASSECAPGCFCGSDSTCAEAGFCDRAGDCARGYTCNVARHSCEPEKPNTTLPKSCRVQADCGIGNECADAKCRPVPVPGNHCVFNRDCGTDGQCVDGLCRSACDDDDTCGTGRACVNQRCVAKPAANGACVSNAQCGSGQSCIDGVCHLGCSKDAECQANNRNDYCASSVCRPDERRQPECRKNAECQSGQECVDAQCRTFCVASSDCALCGEATVCSAGYCRTTHEVAPQCKLAADCNGGTAHCVDASCSQ